MGIRAALGARPADVLRLVLRDGLRLVLLGLGFGIAASLILTRLVSSVLYGVAPRDPFTFMASTVLVVVAAFLACYIPARRAAQVDPIVAMRYE
jgi:putative ABC transport system permease protein